MRTDLDVKMGKSILFILPVLACSICAVPAVAMIAAIMQGGERKNVSHLIAVGKTPIDIRVVAIHDPMLVSAILKGAKTRQISVLVDQNSKELSALLAQRNIRIRISPISQKRRFGQEKLSSLFVLEVGDGYYKEWDGALIWTKKAFKRKTIFLMGGGKGPGENWADMSRAFDRDFSRAAPIQ
ncbi:MAG: hypothetical protein ABIY70_22740 [Capsulimonas sp.]|uniref:hypothetical protein n=1 Tax=Capsulimonas sp. TaxID=2494211 RepID=UPI00326661A7